MARKKEARQLINRYDEVPFRMVRYSLRLISFHFDYSFQFTFLS